MRLVKGCGDIKTGACWMSAISYYAGYAWSDHPECVDPVIQCLCIALNDRLPSDAERERVIGPHIMTPIGTQQGTDLTRQRMLIVADEAVRVWAPMDLDACGLSNEAEILRSLPEIVDHLTAGDAAKAASHAAKIAPYVSYSASYTVSNASYAARLASCVDKVYPYASYTASHAAKAATFAASFAASYTTEADHTAEMIKTSYESLMLPLILRLCAMGERKEVPQIRQLCELPN